MSGVREMTTYSIYHGGTEIEPADSTIKQIYAGSQLIWERASKINVDLTGYVFTKKGMLVPKTVNGTDEFYAYDLNLKKIKLDFSNCSMGSDSFSFVWTDDMVYQNGAQYVKSSNGIFTEYNSNSLIDDTQSKWSNRVLQDYYDGDETYRSKADSTGSSITSYVGNTPVVIKHGGGNGIEVLSSAVRGVTGYDAARNLNYVDSKGNLVTGENMDVLAVCGDYLVCYTDITIERKSSDAAAGQNLGSIVITDLDKNVIYTPFNNKRSYDALSTQAGGFLQYNFVGTKLFFGSQFMYDVTTKKQTTFSSSYIDSIYHIYYINSYYYTRSGAMLYYSKNCSSFSYLTLSDSSGGYYPIQNTTEAGGLYSDGESIYVIGQYYKLIDGKKKFRLFKITGTEVTPCGNG